MPVIPLKLPNSRILDTNLTLSHRMSLSSRAALFEGLFTMSEAGVDLTKALSIIKSALPKQRDRSDIDLILTMLVSGKSLSESLSASGKFELFEVQSILVGETTGELPRVLGLLADHYSKRVDQKTKIWSSLTYPIIIIAVALFAVFVMLAYVVPMFESVITRFGEELPMMTRILIDVAHSAQPIAMILVLTVTGVFILKRSIGQREVIQMFFEGITLKIPLLGQWSKAFELSKIYRGLALMLNAGTNLVEALELVSSTCNMIRYRNLLKESISQIEKGFPLWKSFSHGGLIPEKDLGMIEAGEQSARLVRVFEGISNQYDRELERISSRLQSSLEPVLILTVGGIVLLILISLYLPIFDISKGIG